MTGYRSRHFRHDCVPDGCYYGCLPDWDDLIECFPRGIRPTDIDGMVEIAGNFLFLEEKRAGVTPPDAQRLALRKLSQHPGITTLFFRPQLHSPDDVECLIFGEGPAQGWQQMSRPALRDWLSAWAARADADSHAALSLGR